ncbi:sulfur carrier protein ThiS [Ancylobacter pratisalsi]|uniref:Sulfur carrier protein ThiS n=1 Tax=Ancylobacter pratisalsi TaxID=1745854 RepID=A0A6P1YLF4_9HYPH|nr:sulfur carrier protein ThiS [Ancylobacter pratisalsi]QIB33053.1 sulfur carrier protein ThiS [Ancylobacter pratisalsi]
MKIIVNGEPADTGAGTLAELLGELGLAEAIIATALNGAVVRAVKRSGTPIADGDRVEILAPMQGG